MTAKQGKKRVACFFTAGYTELNAMKRFMQRINADVEYIQLCPIGPRKSREMIKNRERASINSENNGLTGAALIEHVVKTVRRDNFVREKYDVILIEDDKDDRFLEIQADGTATINEAEWLTYKTDVTTQIHAVCPDIPVLFFYAAPEVEAWFLADWSNSFGKAYEKIFKEDNPYFSTVLHSYVKREILTEAYEHSIEHYGYFDRTYKKLSAELQDAVERVELPRCEDKRMGLRYSKKTHGPAMLDALDPEIVWSRCNYFFRSGFRELQTL